MCIRDSDMVVSGNGLETIGSDAFAGCDSLTGVEVPDSVTAVSYTHLDVYKR